MATNVDQQVPNEVNDGSNLRTSPPPKSWLGALIDGQLWCDCKPRRRGKCLTSTKFNKNKGERFWGCPRSIKDPRRCHFFIWAKEEAEARDWLARYGPQEAPETPTKEDRPKQANSKDTPWTIAKRKLVSREISDENENGGPSTRKVEDCDGGDQREESPSRKVPKATRFSTAGGQTFNDRLREAALPTPDSNAKGKGKAFDIPIEAENVGPAEFEDASKPSRSGERDLTTTILKLLREENVDLRESTELQLRHEIELELDLNAVTVKRYDETISTMSARLDELESVIVHLTGNGSIYDPIDLSDTSD